MSELSSAAQAVLAACGCPDPDSPFRLVARGFAAAALRAVADQVVPEQELDDVPGRFVNGCCHEQRQKNRAELLAIADELESR